MSVAGRQPLSRVCNVKGLVAQWKTFLEQGARGKRATCNNASTRRADAGVRKSQAGTIPHATAVVRFCNRRHRSERCQRALSMCSLCAANR